MTPLLVLATLALAATPDASVLTATPGVSAGAIVAAQGSPLRRDTLLGRISGRVLSQGSGTPIAYAFIQVSASGGIRSTFADGEARYAVSDLPRGLYQIRATALGHAPLEIEVELSPPGELLLDLILPVTPIDLPALAVVTRRGVPDGARDSAAPAAPGSPADPQVRALEATPGAAEMGLAGNPRDGPPDPLEPSGVLYVRGAASDLKLVLLDGAPVYAPFHLAGLLNAFLPHVLERARLYVGGAPARYDGGLSYILDLETRPGDREGFRSGGAVDAVAASTHFAGPAGPLVYRAAGRWLHRWGADHMTGERLPYGYADALARADLDIAEGHRIAATGFFNRESVRLEGSGPLNGRAYWGNTAGSLRHAAHLGATRAEITAAHGQFETRLPIRQDSARSARLAQGRSLRSRLSADFSRGDDTFSTRYGALYERQRLDLRPSPLSDTAAAPRSRRAEGEAVGAYLDVRWKASPEVELRGGLRANAFVAAGDLRWAPRLGVAWKASEHSTLSLALGRYHQYIRSTETILAGDLNEVWDALLADSATATASSRGANGLARDRLGVAGATHLVVGLDHAAREELRVGVEAFYKAFEGVPQSDGLRAAGADLWFHWVRGGWEAWAGYSLAWVWISEAASTDGDRFSGRQLLSAGVAIPLPSTARLDLRLASSSGLPLSPIPLRTGEEALSGETRGADFVSESARNPFLAGAPDGSYLRIDVTLSRTLPARLLGTEFRMTPYLRVLNALDRRDALFYQIDTTHDRRPRSLAAVPLLPVLGIEWGQ